MFSGWNTLRNTLAPPAFAPGGIVRAFAGDGRGNVAITFGLMLLVMVAGMGGAVDIGRWLQARTKTLAAIDAAVLAGGRLLQLDSGNISGAVAAAANYYQQNVADRPGIHNDTVKFSASQSGTEFGASGNAYIRTPFLNVIGIDELPLLSFSGTDFAKSILAVGGNAMTNIEISLMLDITGSMGGQKIADLKTAAKDLIDIVVWADQSKNTSRVALVPFSETVNVGSYADAVRGSVPATYTFTKQGGGSATGYRTNCVTERTGAEAYTDEAPATAPVGRHYTGSGHCNPVNQIVPLSANKSALKSAIDSYNADGYTAGHLGTAWAWYMLSPSWASLWPAASQPEPYSRMTETGPEGQPKLRKIAILMTDGEYNTQYCNGVADKNTSLSPRINCASPNGSATSQARSLCTEMKKTGIEVYSIGFALAANSSATTTLRDYCASDESRFYPASDGAQLRQAFRDIALKISTLYLSK
jgi:hypothetical protein